MKKPYTDHKPWASKAENVLIWDVILKYISKLKKNLKVFYYYLHGYLNEKKVIMLFCKLVLKEFFTSVISLHILFFYNVFIMPNQLFS